MYVYMYFCILMIYPLYHHSISIISPTNLPNNISRGFPNPQKTYPPSNLRGSYQTYFCQVPFAHRLRPVGTTGRLDRWCSRMAVCLSSRLVPPIVAANVLRVLGAPDLKSCELPGLDVEGVKLPIFGEIFVEFPIFDGYNHVKLPVFMVKPCEVRIF